MQTLFTIFFGVGVGYSVISFLLGNVIGGSDSLDASGMLPFLKPTVISTFITVFGGSGLILLQFVSPLTALPLAGLFGAIIAYGLYRLVVLPLFKAQATVLEIQSLIGHVAQVAEKIPQGQYGKITYKVDGNTYSAPSKSVDGREIARYTSVEIIYIEKNTYYVSPI